MGEYQKRGGIGQSSALGVGGAQLAVRQEKVKQITIKAIQAGNASLGAYAPRYSNSRNQEAQEGLNNLGKSLMPKEKSGWGWCVAGNRPPQHPGGAGLRKSQSSGDIKPVDNPLTRSESYVACPNGEMPFFGEPRSFGDQVWDGRMRGGALAQSGWAGTFPNSCSRGCMPWAS
eukprot:TRINITY_DN101605_c0_g1_i1.p1 TRINITY_DN101605_c0_g1~~TRINITY_DN101605_c0_g1_i1.p1  ORF type:complete len:173 (+),score=22.28 TRINITY_DN101605_c0_g1_i1:76-594(+)